MKFAFFSSQLFQYPNERILNTPRLLDVGVFFLEREKRGERGGGGKTTVNRHHLKSLEMLSFGFYWNFIDILFHLTFNRFSSDQYDKWHLIPDFDCISTFYPLSLQHVWLFFIWGLISNSDQMKSEWKRRRFSFNLGFWNYWLPLLGCQLQMAKSFNWFQRFLLQIFPTFISSRIVIQIYLKEFFKRKLCTLVLGPHQYFCFILLFFLGKFQI